MAGFTIFAVIVLAVGAVGLLFQKNGEFAGLGRPAKRGGLRAPHGRLVRTKRLDTFEDLPFSAKFPQAFLVTFAITVVIGALCLFGVLSLVSVVPVSLDILCVTVAACCLTQADAGVVRAFAYALFGYMAAAVLATIVGMAAGAGVDMVNALTMVAGTLGASAAVAWMPLVRTYAREFEDGHVNVIKVSAKSAAARAFDPLCDQAWKPPADRIADAEAAENLREHMKKRADDLDERSKSYGRTDEGDAAAPDKPAKSGRSAKRGARLGRR
ncbi:MAG: hypothetical protein Q4C41_05105 [Eggerthellaceae bacterium]|nr:hypothetical protein [Eggerthellaceae bacterium]